MTRPLAFALGALALVLAAFLWLRDAPTSPRRAAPASTVSTPRPTPSPAPHPTPLAPAPTPRLADDVPAAFEPDEPEELLPPPIPDQIAPRPERVEPTPAEIREQKLASLDLIARGIEHLEREREAALKAGDAETARLNVHRIERLRRRGAEIEQELARADDLEAPPEHDE